MILNNLSQNESKILIESLLAAVEARDNDIANLKNKCKAEMAATSLLRRYLVEEQPELTDSLCHFIMDGKRHDMYYDNFYDGALCALEYHNDTIDSPILKTAIEVLEESAGKK